MCRMTGKDVGRERHFKVIIQGVGRRKTWDFKATIQQDYVGDPYMYFDLRGAHGREKNKNRKFELGHLLMTIGAAELGVDLMPYMERHATGDWEHMTGRDRQLNKRAIKNDDRIFTSCEIPFEKENKSWVETVFIITERGCLTTTIMRADEH